AATNRYSITPLGLAEAERVNLQFSTTGESSRSPQQVYAAVEPFVFHRVFLDHCRDPNEPRTWLGASAFLALTQNSGVALDDRLRAVRGSVAQALSWLEEHQQESLRSGPVGGKRTITRTALVQLSDFLDILDERFKAQMAALRKRR